VTLDPDVERLIRDAMRARAISFKEALNEAARIGLRGKERKRDWKFTQKTFRMGEGFVRAGTGGNLTSDAHLAALAIEHGAELCSSDTDFARFRGLKWRNPLR
jgi:predicted nucleic acid-binding protein